MASTEAIVTLYVIAGGLELSAVALTAFDLRMRTRSADSFAASGHPQDPRDAIVENAAAARGGSSWRQVERLSQPIEDALRGPWLKVAAGLLALGIIVGTIANVLSATR